MRKFFTFAVALMAMLAINAKETVVWEGNEPISWNPEVYVGEQFETPNGTFSGLVKDDTIKVTVIAQIETPQYVMTYKAGTGWTWTDLTDVTVADGLMIYIVASDEIAQWIAERGLIFRGQGYDMTKIVVASKEDEPEPEPEPLQPGETKVLWEGEETLSWNEVATQPASIGALLAEKDQIIVTVSAKGAADWPKVLLRDMSSNQVGDDILLNEVSEFPYDAVFTLTATDVEALKEGFKLCGDGVTVTKMVLQKYKEEEQPEEPGEEYEDRDVWTGDKAISWNQDVYAGVEFDTYVEQQDMLAGVAKDDNIKIYYAEAIDGAQFALTYKAGDNWAWTDLAIAEHDGFFAYKVETEQIAQDIADHGLILRGQGYHATRIVIGKPKSSVGIEEIMQQPSFAGKKILYEGQVLIIRENAIYNIFGQKIQ